MLKKFIVFLICIVSAGLLAFLFPFILGFSQNFEIDVHLYLILFFVYATHMNRKAIQYGNKTKFQKKLIIYTLVSLLIMSLVSRGLSILVFIISIIAILNLMRKMLL